MSSLGEEFPKEQARVRELLEDYKAIGKAGAFGAMMIEAALRRADESAIRGQDPQIGGEVRSERR